MASWPRTRRRRVSSCLSSVFCPPPCHLSSLGPSREKGMNAMGWANGRHALITGGGTGIGAATARLLAAEGASVTLLGRRREPLEAVAAEFGGTVIACDITD